MTFITFIAFTAFVALFATWKLRRDALQTQDGYFLGGRSLTGIIIAGSLLLTNISTEHLVGMNGSAYKNGAIIIAWEVTSALALIVAALYFAPRYLKMGLNGSTGSPAPWWPCCLSSPLRPPCFPLYFTQGP